MLQEQPHKRPQARTEMNRQQEEGERMEGKWNCEKEKARRCSIEIRKWTNYVKCENIEIRRPPKEATVGFKTC